MLHKTASLLASSVLFLSSYVETDYSAADSRHKKLRRSPTSRSSCLDSKVPGEPAAFQWGTAIEELPKAFPFGGPNARKTVQWTVFSEVGPAGPWDGGFRRNCLQFCRKTDEVVNRIRLLLHSHRLFYSLRSMSRQIFCGGFPAQETSALAHAAVELPRFESAGEFRRFSEGNSDRGTAKSLPLWGGFDLTGGSLCQARPSPRFS